MWAEADRPSGSSAEFYGWLLLPGHAQAVHLAQLKHQQERKLEGADVTSVLSGLQILTLEKLELENFGFEKCMLFIIKQRQINFLWTD